MLDFIDRASVSAFFLYHVLSALGIAQDCFCEILRVPRHIGFCGVELAALGRLSASSYYLVSTGWLRRQRVVVSFFIGSLHFIRGLGFKHQILRKRGHVCWFLETAGLRGGRQHEAHWLGGDLPALTVLLCVEGYV